MEPDFTKGNGLIPVIVQDLHSNDVLMLAYMNREAWEKTLTSGKATFFSRSRNELWVKGESSGYVQLVKEIYIDCDNDTVLLKVEQLGGASCHTGYRSCFFRRLADGGWETIGQKVFEPDDVYGRGK